MPFQVFIERPRDPSPEGIRALAQAVAERFGVPAEELIGRLRKGRFRVKANLDDMRARRFMELLETLGALCSVVDERGQLVASSSELVASARAQARPPERELSALSLHTPPPEPRQRAQPRTPVPGTSESPLYESGLAAAAGARQQDLGALGEDQAFELAALDDGQSADREPAAPPAAASTSPDAFLPPDVVAKPVELDVEVAEVEATPPQIPVQGKDATVAAAPAAPTAEEAHRAAPGPKTDAPRMRESPIAFLARSPRPRFAIGLALAAALGFLPAHFFASAREDVKYSPILVELRAEQVAAAESPERWEALDAVRSEARERLSARQGGIFVSALIVWAAAALGLAFLWFYKIPWRELAARPSPPA